MKKILAVILTLAFALGLTACGSGDGGSSDGEVSVFYYTYSDAYISSVRSAMDKFLKDAGLKFQNYDANGNQTTQTEQVTTALAKGSKLLVVNVVDTGSNDAAQNIIDQAKAKNVPVIFFNRSVQESVVTSYDKCVFVGTDYEMAGHMQGEMIGKYLVENYNKLDLNGDGKISYVMFKGQEGNMEAIARTQYGVEDANKVLKAAGKPELEFYDASNKNKYLVDQNGQWSSAAATDYMQTAGYNKEGAKAIPVFGVDATDAAKSAIKSGAMVSTIKQDADGMAKAITSIAQNFLGDKEALDGLDSENLVGKWRVNIPYATYTGE